ncbi:sensor domain-containing protein [Streptomyces sp. NBC_01142]|uniref:sensor histidine kinase n=1 Tax=Streptomyces sp. NBC_01142 TaxID=2975865 RepID=UPI002258381C|nr:sensor histidine kinase [Streptomyces sp. NBC_01142]MCX4823325.1 sensor domain-containing protein [Streptomyces sp. NBC_01142]
MDARTPWQALTRGNYLRSAWPWRSAGYLASSALTGIAALLALVVLVVFSLILVGLPLLVLAGVALAVLERRRLRLVDLEPAPSPHRTPAEPGLGAWLRLRLTEQATWRELAYGLLHALVLWPLDALAVAVAIGVPAAMTAAPVQLALDGEEARVVKGPLVTTYPQAFAAAVAGLVLLAVLLHPLAALAGARAQLTRLLLAPRESELRDRLTEVTRSRARLVSAFEAERRRIERDLHDGAQQRLVALTMTLGLARLDVTAGPLADRLATAHDEAGQVLTELRELIHGIHPQVLADYGLGAALADAADRSAVPVDTAVELPRLDRSVETAAYFAVCEALANVAKHSGADRAGLTARHRHGMLEISVRDDGAGGADPAHGSGLTGLADRIAVLDGTLTITSPPDGPTVLRVEIPCEPTESRPTESRPAAGELAAGRPAASEPAGRSR